MLTRRFGCSVALALLVGSAAPNPAHAAANVSYREGLLRAKPAVVLVIAEVESEVTLDCGDGPTMVTLPAFRETGTGWFIDSHGWVVTNAHVVQPAHETPRWLVHHQAQRAVTTACLPRALERAGITPGEDPAAEDTIKRKLLDHVLPTARVTLHPHVAVLAPNGSRVEAEVKKYAPPVSTAPGSPSARDLALLKIPGDTYPVLRLADSKAIQIGDPLHIIGFPAVVLAHELLNESASTEASVTNGAVSGFKQDKSNHLFIQTDAPASWGTSGAPVVDDRGAVVGMLTFVSVAPGPEGSIVQGFNFVIPSRAVKSFVQDTPVTADSDGKFNPIWYAGLRAFFTEDWKGAVHQFEQADKSLPGLPDVKRMLGDARDMVEHPPRRPFPWFRMAIALMFVSAGGYWVQFYRRLQNNHHQPLEILPSMRPAPEELESGFVTWANAGLMIDNRSDLSEVVRELYKALTTGRHVFIATFVTGSAGPQHLTASAGPRNHQSPLPKAQHRICPTDSTGAAAIFGSDESRFRRGHDPCPTRVLQRQAGDHARGQPQAHGRHVAPVEPCLAPMRVRAEGGKHSGATAVAGPATSARARRDCASSGPTGPGWAPLSRTTPR